MLKILQDKKLTPLVDINPDLDNLGTESAFSFGAEVLALEKEKKFPQIYKFHIGDTGPTTPEPIIETAVKALKNKQTKYGHFLGFPQVRENIARHVSELSGVEIKIENVMLEPGGKPAIELALQALVGHDDYVVGQNPGFPIYESLAGFYTRGKYIPWLAGYSVANKAVLEFRVEDLEEIMKSGKKVKLLIINTPQNPTGMVLSEDKLSAIAELAKKYKFMVLFDDIYDRILFGGKKHVSLLSFPGMLDYTINLSGYSKNYAMTGWRLGYVVAPAWLIEIFGRLAVNKWSCVSRVNQIVAGAIFGDVELDGVKYESLKEKLDPLVEKDVAEYEHKGKFLVETLRLLEPYVVPNEVEGAFYDFPNIHAVLELPYVKNELKISSDKDFSRWLLYEKGFAALPGGDFGQAGRGHLRLSYAEDRNKHIIPGVKHFVNIVLELIEKSGLKSPLTVIEAEKRIEELTDKYFQD